MFIFRIHETLTFEIVLLLSPLQSMFVDVSHHEIPQRSSRQRNQSRKPGNESQSRNLLRKLFLMYIVSEFVNEQCCCNVVFVWTTTVIASESARAPFPEAILEVRLFDDDLCMGSVQRKPLLIFSPIRLIEILPRQLVSIPNTQVSSKNSNALAGPPQCDLMPLNTGPHSAFPL